WADAVPLLSQALEIRETAAGPNHPFTALVVFTLGEVALAQEDWEKAVGLFSRVVAIRQQTFGAVHQSLIYPLTRLGISFHALGVLDQAEMSFSQALEIWSTVPLPVSPEYLMTLEAAADLYRATGQQDRARALDATAEEFRELP
ncbi:MAG: tetratricopeptide repeat protein, partial [Alphaproteobacteria bacterium]|nr:tetratricopeptide repeat protein [Alphaproteobacteria bacterium]